MGILERMIHMTKAAANEMLDKVENPVMMLNHYLRDLDEEIMKAERSLAQQQAQERMFVSKYDEASAGAAHYESKAEQAAAEEREVEARAALEAKLLYLEQAEEASKLRELAKKATLELELHIDSLRAEKQKLQEKREELLARMRRTGGSTGSYSSSVHGLQAGAATKGFERIEQKVMEMEAQRELARTSQGAYSSFAPHDLRSEQRNALVEEQYKQLLAKKSGS
ncbi:PspA/IM30 family protein [Paenibacillus sp. HB172176]|uniref:PspA/IM30 family protein n=1 Tax=Paenibacillus sp. HB172176 TaxID=2493690 RepID=UPI00143C1EB2|nr:PspA/IM30 family protein [Paenibacillus sp. HB172176]